jgi:hypothetical protein
VGAAMASEAELSGGWLAGHLHCHVAFQEAPDSTRYLGVSSAAAAAAAVAVEVAVVRVAVCGMPQPGVVARADHRPLESHS